MSQKTRAVWTAIFVAALLMTAKAVVGFVTMSMSVLASALDSLMDVFSMSMGLAAVKTSDKPADEGHPFGHGKAEAIAGMFQALLIAFSSAFLIVQAFHRMIDGYHLKDEAVGVAVMIIATVASIYLARGLKKTGEDTESSALKAGSLNFGADVFTNTGALIALGLERFAAVKNADPVISVLISLYIFISAVRVGRNAMAELMDKTLPEDVLEIISRCVDSYRPFVCGYHNLRTRRAGAEKYIEFHLEIDRAASFESAHNTTEQIISDIQTVIPHSHVTVHSDPV